MSAVRAKTYDELLDDLVAAQGELENLRIRVAVGKELQDALRAERDAAQAETAKYKALWESVPWSAIAYCVNVADRVAPKPETVEAFNWLAANAPKEAGE